MIVSSYGPGGIIGLGDLGFLGLALAFAFASSAHPSERLQNYTYIIVGDGVKCIIVVGNNRAERREREDDKLIIVEERLIERGAMDGDVPSSYHHVVLLS